MQLVTPDSFSVPAHIAVVTPPTVSSNAATPVGTPVPGAVAATLVVLYVLAWVPGKIYYSDGMLPAVIAAGSVSAERWLATDSRDRRLRPRHWLVAAGVW